MYYNTDPLGVKSDSESFVMLSSFTNRLRTLRLYQVAKVLEIDSDREVMNLCV